MGTVTPIGTMTAEYAAMKIVVSFRENLSPQAPASELGEVTHKRAAQVLSEVGIIAQGDIELYAVLEFGLLAKLCVETERLGDKPIDLDDFEQSIMNALVPEVG